MTGTEHTEDSQQLFLKISRVELKQRKSTVHKRKRKKFQFSQKNNKGGSY